MELKAIARVEANLKAPKNRGNPRLIFRGFDLGDIARVALIHPLKYEKTVIIFKFSPYLQLTTQLYAPTKQMHPLQFAIVSLLYLS